MSTLMTHSRIKSVQQAITAVLIKRGKSGATIEELEAYKAELLAVWGYDSMMKEWINELDLNEYVK